MLRNDDCVIVCGYLFGFSTSDFVILGCGRFRGGRWFFWNKDEVLGFFEWSRAVGGVVDFFVYIRVGSCWDTRSKCNKFFRIGWLEVGKNK